MGSDAAIFGPAVSVDWSDVNETPHAHARTSTCDARQWHLVAASFRARSFRSATEREKGRKGGRQEGTEENQ